MMHERHGLWAAVTNKEFVLPRCYHFATQLDGTGHNRVARRQGGKRVLGPKTLIRLHMARRGDMAQIEAHIPLQD